MLMIVKSNVSSMLPPLPSLAVTFIEIVPTSPSSGTPLNVRVPALKLNHGGSGLPFANVAL